MLARGLTMSDPAIAIIDDASRRQQTAVPCNLCGTTSAPVILRKNEWGTEFTIVRCDGCGLVYTNPRRFAVEHDDYFKGVYLTTIERNGHLDPDIEMLYRNTARRLEAWLHPGRLLDIGCAMGHFMNYARTRGWEVCGVEPSLYAANRGRKDFGLQIHTVSVLAEAEFPSGFVDAAVMNEVIEHLPDPAATLADAFRILKPGGWISVTTPNFACYRSLLMKEDWTPIIPSGHLYYFTGETLDRMLRAAGFAEVIEFTGPAAFDGALKFARDQGKLRAEDWEAVRDTLDREDADKVNNRRDEALIVCARKAVSGPPALRAQSKVSDTERWEMEEARRAAWRQLEEARRAAIETGRTAQRHLETICSSPGWRAVVRYRQWMERRRHKPLVGRFLEPAIVSALEWAGLGSPVATSAASRVTDLSENIIAPLPACMEPEPSHISDADPVAVRPGSSC